MRDAGFPYDPDMNGPDSIGVGLVPVNNVDGIRMNTALTYLDPAFDRPNLTVRADAQVRRVLLSGARATGIEVEIDGRLETINAGEVVLSAGAVKSPQLLMTSGLGPAEELRRHGIPVRKELPMVGRAFTDHATIGLPFRMPKRRSLIPDPRRSAWTHAGLHFTSKVSDGISDLLLLQSAIPVNHSVFHGLPLRAKARILKATLGSLSLPTLIDHARFGWNHAITCVLMRDDSRARYA